MIATNDTATPDDDIWINPTSFDYATGENMVTLAFGEDDLGNPLPEYLAPDGVTTYQDLADFATGSLRLRIGNEYEVIDTSIFDLTVADTMIDDSVGSSFSTAEPISTLTSQSIVISAAISPVTYEMQFPGGRDEPGHRDLPRYLGEDFESHTYEDNADIGPDGEIDTLTYTFPTSYADTEEEEFTNLITDAQKDAVRRMFALFQNYCGVQFHEVVPQNDTDPTGDILVILGDPRALNGTGGPYGSDVAATFGPGAVIVSSAIYSNDNGQLGSGFWDAMMWGLLSNLELAFASDLPNLTVMGGGVTTGSPGLSTEAIYPGNADIVHAQLLHRPDSIDIE